MAEQMDQKFVEFVIKALVNNPKEVKVKREVNELGVLLVLDVNPEDVGLVLGRRGHTIRHIRSLLKAIGLKNKSWVSLKINAPEKPAQSQGIYRPYPRRQFSDRPSFNVVEKADRDKQDVDDVINGSLDDLKI